MADEFPTPEFRKKLRREIHLYVQELHDGCAECQELSRTAKTRTFCTEHNKEVLDLVINPRKYIKL